MYANSRLVAADVMESTAYRITASILTLGTSDLLYKNGIITGWATALRNDAETAIIKLNEAVENSRKAFNIRAEEIFKNQSFDLGVLSKISKGLNITFEDSMHLDPNIKKEFDALLNKELSGTVVVDGTNIDLSYDESLFGVKTQIADIEADIESSGETTVYQIDLLNKLNTIRLDLIKQITQELRNQGKAGMFAAATTEAGMRESRANRIAVGKETIGGIVNDLEMSFAPKASGFLEKFFGKDKLFGAASATDNLARQQKDLREEVDTSAQAFLDAAMNLKNLELEYKQLGDEITAVNKLIKEQESILESLEEVLASHDNLTSLLIGKRFKGETAFSKLIEEQSQVIKKRNLEAMGIADAEQTIQNLLGGSAGAWDDVVKKINEVSEAADTSEDKFAAWQTTVKEHIYALGEVGTDLGINTSKAIRDHAGYLLSITKYSDDASDDQVDIEAAKMDALELLSDYHYGGQHREIELLAEAEEDKLMADEIIAEAKHLLAIGEITDIDTIKKLQQLAAGEAPENAAMIIGALELEWKERDKVRVQIIDQQDLIEKLKTEKLTPLEDEFNDLEKEIDAANTALEQMVLNLKAVYDTQQDYPISDLEAEEEEDERNERNKQNNNSMMYSDEFKEDYEKKYQDYHQTSTANIPYPPEWIPPTTQSEGTSSSAINMGRINVDEPGYENTSKYVINGENVYVTPVTEKVEDSPGFFERMGDTISDAWSGFTGLFGFNDFVSRPGQEPFAISPQDTIVGFRGNEIPDFRAQPDIGGGTGNSNTIVEIGNINVSGVSTDNPADFAYEFAEELRRELRTI